MMLSSAQPFFRSVSPTLIVSRPPRTTSATVTNQDRVIINYPLLTSALRPETPECVRERPKEKIVEWHDWKAQPFTKAMRRASYDQGLLQMQKQQDCDAASLNVGPGTDVDDFDDCWAPIRDGMILFGSGGQYIDPAFLFINRKNPPTPASTLPTTLALSTSEVALHVDHLQYKGKTFHLPGHNEEEGYEGGCESTFLPGSRSYHTTLDEEDQEEDSDDLSDCSSILSFDNFGSVMTTPELSFSGLGTPFAMTPEDEMDAQLGTPGLSGSATFQGNNNALGFSFEDKQHQDSFSDDRSLGNAQPDDELEEYPGFPLSSLSPFDRRFPTMADVDEELRRIRVPYDPRIHRKPLPLPLRLMFGALERWAARRTAGLLIPVVDEERGSDARPLDEGK